MGEQHSELAIIGAGNWGTTLALVQARVGRPVLLCCREDAHARQLQTMRENTRSLPGYTLPEEVQVVAGYSAAVTTPFVLLALPSEHLRGVCRQLSPVLSPDQVLVCATKGLERASSLRMSQVISGELPSLAARLCTLSGPNLANEIAADLPAAAVLASTHHDSAQEAVAALATSRFRLYTSDDVIGVELGGAMKNVVAVVAGICDGLALGTNSKAAIVTRGMSEIVRLGRACGADPLTFSGLSGYGDLFATCVSTLSRNHFVGVQIGHGRALPEILGEMTMVAEGVSTAKAAYDLAAQCGVEMPITEQVCAVLFAGKHPRDAMEDLLSRLPRSERTGELL